jgi:hypothetical protein
MPSSFPLCYTERLIHSTSERRRPLSLEETN